MAYDPKSKDIFLGRGSDFLVDSGLFFVDVLREEAISPNAENSIRSDWAIIADWLDWDDSPIEGPAAEKLAQAWKAYIAEKKVKLSPELDPAFTANTEHPTNQYEFPPDDVVAVFNRLIGEDQKTSTKKEEHKTTNSLSSIGTQKLSTNQKLKRLWYNKSKEFRFWSFISASWALVIVLIIAVFDPFNYGSWSYIDGDELVQIVVIILTPELIALLKYAYRNLVEQ
jgi:hypothetical protein